MPRDYSRRLPAGTKVSAASAIGRSVTAYFPFVRDFKSAVRGRPGSGVSTGPVLKPNSTGKAAVGSGTGKIGTGILPTELGMAGASPRTIIVEFWQGDYNYGTSLAPAVFSFGDASGAPRSQFTLLTASNFRRVTLATYSSDFNYVLWDQGGTYARVFLAITYDGNLTIRIRSYCQVFLNNGTPQGIVARTFSSTLPAPLVTGSTYPLDLMGGGPYNFASMNTELYSAAFIGNRVLTDREIDSFYRNPQQIMAAVPSFPYPLLASAPAVVAPIELGGAAAAIATVTGALSTSVRLAGSAQAVATTGASLSSAIRLSGTAQVGAAAAATLSTGIRLAGAADVQASASGQLQGSAISLSGGAYMQASAAGVLSTSIRLVGAAASQAAASGVLSFAAGPIESVDISKISPARIVVFEGSGSRVTRFDGSGSRVTPFDSSGSRVVVFDGSGSE